MNDSLKFLIFISQFNCLILIFIKQIFQNNKEV